MCHRERSYVMLSVLFPHTSPPAPPTPAPPALVASCSKGLSCAVGNEGENSKAELEADHQRESVLPSPRQRGPGRGRLCNGRTWSRSALLPALEAVGFGQQIPNETHPPRG